MMTSPLLILRPEFAPQKGQSTGGAAPAGATPTAPEGVTIGQPPATTQLPTTYSDGSGKPPEQAQGQGTEQCLTQLPFMLLLVGVFYFLLIRPQQKQEKQRRAMVAALKKGDSVVMNSGLHGTIVAISESTVTVNVDQGTQLTFDRVAIQRSASPGSDDGDPPAMLDTSSDSDDS